MSSVFKRLQPADFIVTPFDAFKTWRLTESNASSSFSTYVFYGTYQTGSEITYLIQGKPVDIYPQTINGRYQACVHAGMNTMFYNRWENEPLNTCGAYFNQQQRFLSKYIHDLQIPQQHMGSRIKVGSVHITSSQAETDVSGNRHPDIFLQDDRYGNLYDAKISASMSESIDDELYLVGEWTYEQHHKPKLDLLNYPQEPDTWDIIDYSSYHNHGYTTGSINFSTEGQLTPYVKFQNIPISLTPDYHAIRIPHHQIYNFRDDADFAISTFAQRQGLPLPVSAQTLICKSGLKRDIGIPGLTVDPQYTGPSNLGVLMDVPVTGSYPFDISLNGAGYLTCSRYDGSNLSMVTSPVALDGQGFQHILFQKTGSALEIFIDGVKTATGVDSSSRGTCNESDIFIGAHGDGTQQFGGTQGLYSTRIYKKALTEEEVYTLYKTKYNSANVGNVIYNTGTITITSPIGLQYDQFESLTEVYYKFPYWDVFRVGDNDVDKYTGWTDPDNWAYDWDLDYKSTLTIYQNEILCTAPAGSFNLSMNPTLRETSEAVGCDVMSVEQLKGIVTHSAFTPYATSLGLYNENLELLAIAKFARPIGMIKEADMTFVVRFDVDVGMGGGETKVRSS